MTAARCALVFAALALLLVVQARSPSDMRPVPDSDKDTPSCPSNCSPNRAGQPRRHVCGSDGKTYASACHLRRQDCLNPESNLRVSYRGKCRPNKSTAATTASQGSTQCQEAHRFHASKEQENKFVPDCDSDGNFVPLQCFNVYCWCVDIVNGNPIPNTYIENNKPDCNKAQVGSKPKRPSTNNRPSPRKATQQPRASDFPIGKFQHTEKPKKVCDSMDRLTFNKNLLNSIVVDMRQQHITKTENIGDRIMENTNEPETQRKILELKFTSLDTNGDHVLEKKEYRSLRKYARLNVLPRRCSHSFMQRCDLNKDTKITKDEWLGCLGFDTHRSIPGDIPILPDDRPGSTGSNEGGSSEQDSSEGCFFERKSAQDQDAKNLYVPECTDDGKYQRKQCYPSTGYCFCVDEDDGKMQPGSIVLNSEPQCEARRSSSTVKPPLFMVKCNEEKRKRFLVKFRELMSSKVIDYSSWSSTDSKGDKGKYEKLVSASFFDSLDKNKDQALDKKEWKDFRKIIDEAADINKQCGRRFLRYCDSDNDSKVSRTEWETCISTRKTPRLQASFEGSFLSKPSTNRRGKNPMESLLIHD